MTVPALAEKPYEAALFDLSKPLSLHEAARIVTELQHELDNIDLSAEAAFKAHILLGQTFRRLKKFKEALEQFRQAHVLSPSSADLMIATGATLLDLGLVEQAVHLLVQVADRAPHNAAGLANLAEGYARLGFTEDAHETFAQAAQMVDPYNREELFLLSFQAGIIGLEAESVEYFARFLALRDGFDLGEKRAVDILLERAGTYEECFVEHSPIRRAVDFFLAFERAVQAPKVLPSESSRGALGMFEATAPMRERAVAGHGEVRR